MYNTLNLEFVSAESYVYSWTKEGEEVDFHLHVGKYYCDRLYIVITDGSLLLKKDIKFLNYIDKAITEFELKMCDIFGFFKKEINREILVRISFNSFHINYGPIIHSELNDLLKGIRKDIFTKVEKIKPENLY